MRAPTQEEMNNARRVTSESHRLKCNICGSFQYVNHKGNFRCSNPNCVRRR